MVNTITGSSFGTIAAIFLIVCFASTTVGLKCYQCGGLSGLPCVGFHTDKIEYQKVCNSTVQSCITSYSNGVVKLRDCWTNKADTTSACDGVNSLMLCMCANSDFCNCHSNPDLNGEKCPVPPNNAVKLTSVIQFYLFSSLLTILTWRNTNSSNINIYIHTMNC